MLKYDSSAKLANAYAIRIDSGALFKDTLLNLLPAGWVEGLKIKRNGGCSLWIIDTKGNLDTYHLHIAKEGFIKHAHGHHIIDKPQKIRKFPVRCVCEVLR